MELAAADSGETVPDQLVEAVMLGRGSRAFLRWLAGHVEVVALLAVSCGYGLAIGYLAFALGPMGLSPLTSGYSAADVTPYAIAGAVGLVAAGAPIGLLLAKAWRLGYVIGSVVRRVLPQRREVAVAGFTAVTGALMWFVSTGSRLRASVTLALCVAMALTAAMRAGLELLTSVTRIGHTLALLSSTVIASLGLGSVAFDLVVHGVDHPIQALESISDADSAEIASGAYELSGWHRVIGFELMRVSSADGTGHLYDGRCFVFVNTVDGMALLWQGGELGAFRISLDGLALTECTD